VGISRRAVIIGSALLGAAGGVGGWTLLADLRLVPGRGVVDQVLGRCRLDTEPAEAEPGLVVSQSFYSEHRARSVGYRLAYPPGASGGSGLPVCVVLHGAGDDETAAFDGLGYHRLLAAAVAAGVPPFVLASVDGGASNWHPRASGDDALGMLLDEVPVVLEQHGLPADKLALLGWSTGGYGALLAASEAADRFVAVAASGPALWRSFDEANEASPGSFDSADDWRIWGDMRTRVGQLRDVALRIDCGESDPFAPALASLRERMPDPASVHITGGCHDDTFWRSAAPEQLRMIGTALTPPPAQ
jgi:S-formylglutathione hydrolase FrmB